MPRKHAFNSLEELLVHMKCTEEDRNNNIWAIPGIPSFDKCRRFWIKKWKKHVEKHGNVPFVLDSSYEQELKIDIKLGKYREKRPSKRLRDEMKQ